MELEALLLNAMLEAGASSSLARVHAADFAALISPKIQRENDMRVARAMFGTWSAEKVAEAAHCCRATVYNWNRRKSKTGVAA